MTTVEYMKFDRQRHEHSAQDDPCPGIFARDAAPHSRGVLHNVLAFWRARRSVAALDEVRVAPSESP